MFCILILIRFPALNPFVVRSTPSHEKKVRRFEGQMVWWQRLISVVLFVVPSDHQTILPSYLF